MPHLTNTRRITCASLALLATFAFHSLWLGGLDRDAAVTVAAATRA